MNRLSILLPVALFVAVTLAVGGCGQDPAGPQPVVEQPDLAQRLIGKWQGPGQSNADESDAAAAAVGAAMGRYEMTAEFRADGTSSVAIAIGGLSDPNPWSGAWKIVAAEANRATVEYTGNVDGQMRTMRAEIELLGDNQITYLDPGDSAMPRFLLSRVSEP